MDCGRAASIWTLPPWVIIYRGKIMADDSVESLRKLANLPSLEEIFTQLVEQRDLQAVARDIASAIRACAH